MNIMKSFELIEETIEVMSQKHLKDDLEREFNKIKRVLTLYIDASYGTNDIANVDYSRLQMAMDAMIEE